MCVCNKWWYGTERISNSHSASSHLSGEFQLLHSICILAYLALNKAVPPQPRTSPHVTDFMCVKFLWVHLNRKSVLYSVSPPCNLDAFFLNWKTLRWNRATIRKTIPNYIPMIFFETGRSQRSDRPTVIWINLQDWIYIGHSEALRSRTKIYFLKQRHTLY